HSHLSTFPFPPCLLRFFFNATPTTEISSLSLHDALPIWAPARKRTGLRMATSELGGPHVGRSGRSRETPTGPGPGRRGVRPCPRSEEHTSELQSLTNLVCRLLLEKKKQAQHHNSKITEHN